MSTHGTIAIARGTISVNRRGFLDLKKARIEGRYHHFDSYPTGLGLGLATLLAHTRYTSLSPEEGWSLFLDDLLVKHPAGFSCIIEQNPDGVPGYSEYPNPPERYPGLTCYCHGDRAEEGVVITEKNIAPWTYLYILTFDTFIGEDKEEVVNRMAHCFYLDREGDDEAGPIKARYLGSLGLDWNGQEPSWQRIEEELDKPEGTRPMHYSLMVPANNRRKYPELLPAPLTETVPSPVKVWNCIVSRQGSPFVATVTTRNAALWSLYGYVKTFWHGFFEEAVPTNVEEAIERYFAQEAAGATEEYELRYAEVMTEGAAMKAAKDA